MDRARHPFSAKIGSQQPHRQDQLQQLQQPPQKSLSPPLSAAICRGNRPAAEPEYPAQETALGLRSLIGNPFAHQVRQPHHTSGDSIFIDDHQAGDLLGTHRCQGVDR